MAEGKHTPGQWSFRKDDMLIIRKARSLLDTLHIAEVKRQGPETEANGHLIAAAPDMLEALDEARTALTNDRDTFYDSVTTANGEFTDPADGEELAEMDRLLLKVHAALAKAKGQTP